MNFSFAAVVVAQTELFGLTFAIFGILYSHKQTGGKQGNFQPNHAPPPPPPPQDRDHDNRVGQLSHVTKLLPQVEYKQKHMACGCMQRCRLLGPMLQNRVIITT